MPLPVPLHGRLPNTWRLLRPERTRADGVALVAVHPGSVRHGFAANITVSERMRTDDATLVDIADESLGELAREAQRVSLTRRTEFGSAAVPGLSQTVRLRHDKDGAVQQLSQCQVYLSMRDSVDEKRRAVIQLVLTATVDQLDDVLDDFRELVTSLRPG